MSITLTGRFVTVARAQQLLRIPSKSYMSMLLHSGALEYTRVASGLSESHSYHVELVTCHLNPEDRHVSRRKRKVQMPAWAGGDRMSDATPRPWQHSEHR
jgi:hypothetical protein